MTGQKVTENGNESAAPDEAVEAVADAVLDHWLRVSADRCMCGEFISSDPQQVARHLAKATLAAAAPFIAAQALDDAADGFHARLSDGTGNGRAYNSYTVARMLREQAAAYRSEQ